MERRQQARTPVNINAMLIGEKTVPKGCRIINVSQQGMLLYCDADGRLDTFNDGDTVDVHLTIQHAGEQKKLTLQAIVRHVAENSVDVEFPRPDPILMELIESYRVSDQHSLLATFGQNHTSDITQLRMPDQRERRAGTPGPTAESGNTRKPWPVYMPLVALILGLCIVAGGYIYTASIENRISILESRLYQQADDLSELRNRTFSFGLQEGRYNSLDARLQALSAAVSVINREAPILEEIADTSPVSEPPAAPDAPAAGAPASAAEATSADDIEEAGKVPQSQAQAGPDIEADTITSLAAQVAPDTNTAADQRTAQSDIDAGTRSEASVSAQSTKTSPEVADQSVPASPAGQDKSTGAWRINLLSSPDRGDVVRLANKATALDITTQIVQAEIRGRTWWRLQVTGFNSKAEATTASIPIRHDLELGEVWILEQN